MKLKIFILTFFSVIVFPLFHEISHYISANIIGNSVKEFNYSYIVTYGSNLSVTDYVFLKTSGLICTFYLSLVLFLFLWKRKSVYSILPQVWLALAPSSGIRDFLDVCDVLVLPFQNYYRIFLNASSLLLVSTLYLSAREYSSRLLFQGT